MTDDITKLGKMEDSKTFEDLENEQREAGGLGGLTSLAAATTSSGGSR